MNYITSQDSKQDMMLIFDSKTNSNRAASKGFTVRVSVSGAGKNRATSKGFSVRYRFLVQVKPELHVYLKGLVY